MNFLATILVLVAFLANVSAHGRWKCPGPRDALDENGVHIKNANTGNKNGACGPESMKWGFGNVTTISPGWNTLSWEESISHAGSPFRIAILDETETARIVLLDHIPHNDASSPHNEVESSFVTYRMSVYVPDVDCKKCSLQFLYIMTDKSNICGIPECYYNPLDSACKGSTDPAAKTCYGAPNDTPCVQEGECYSNYHSCTDVVITGKLPLSSFNIDGQLEDWPYKSKKMQYYGTEASTWSTDGWLQGIPLQYTIDYKTLAC